MNYFELFSLPVNFTVDVAKLSTAYRDLQRTVHPDKFAHASEQQQLLSVQKAAQINDAFQTLKHPVSRAEYLLSLAGIELQHEHQTLKDPVFLMQQMELREELEEISETADPEAAIAAFERQLKGMIADLQANIQRLLDDGESKALAQAADEVRKLKFKLKLQQELEQLEERLLTI